MARTRAAERPPRIFLGVVEIAGYYTNLLSGLKELGVDAVFVSLSDHPFKYPGTGRGEPRLARWIRRVGHRRTGGRAADARITQAGLLLLEGLLRVSLLGWASYRFDAFIFGAGTSITGMPRMEYPLLRLFRRRIICVYHGSDTRPPYMNGSRVPLTGSIDVGRAIEMTVEAKARARLGDRYADWVVTNPASGHFHEKPAISGFCIGVPIRSAVTASPEERGQTTTTTRILHSPSNSAAKGTVRIRAAIDALTKQGHEIDYVEIVGRPNAEVLQELSRCDLVIDQLYSDTPMAGFATEAASFGKPAIVGGYAESVFQQLIPPHARAPSVYCDPDDLLGTIERLLDDQHLRTEIGARSKAFVELEWSPSKVAERYLRLLSGDIPPEWIFDPAEIRYLYGSGLPAERVREVVRQMVDAGGVQVLQVGDKPQLESLFLELTDP